jgi:hypothetical protein
MNNPNKECLHTFSFSPAMGVPIIQLYKSAKRASQRSVSLVPSIEIMDSVSWYSGHIHLKFVNVTYQKPV